MPVRFPIGEILTVMLAGTIMLGCAKVTPSQHADHQSEHRHDHIQIARHAGHSHSSHGPHHGDLIELGNGKFHAELVHDEASGAVRIFLLDTEATGNVAISDPSLTLNLIVQGKPVQFILSAIPLDHDPAGHSSQFVRIDTRLGESLHEPRTKGRINVTIDGKHFVGHIEHHEHSHHSMTAHAGSATHHVH